MKRLDGKRNFLFPLFLGLCFMLMLLIESSVLAVFFGGPEMPDLLLVMVVCLAFIRGGQKGMVPGLLAGLLQDVFSGPAIGYFALAKMITAFLVGLASQEMYKDQLIGLTAIVLLATVVHEIIIISLSLLFWDGAGSLSNLLTFPFLEKLLYHLLLAVLFYLLLQRAEQRGYLKIFPEY